MNHSNALPVRFVVSRSVREANQSEPHKSHRTKLVDKVTRLFASLFEQ
jgi:hypothetical protein